MAVDRQRQFYKEFILLYKSFPCLWDTTSKAYIDRTAKQLAYGQLVQKFKEIDKKATRATVARKINALRTCYRREMSKISKSLRSGGSEKNVYKPTLWYFDLFSFLDEGKRQEGHLPYIDCDTSAAGQHSTMEEIVEKVEIEYIDDDTHLDSINGCASTVEERLHSPCNVRTSSIVIEPSYGKRKNSTIGHRGDPSVGNAEVDDDSLFRAKQEDASDIFGKHIAHKLRSLSRQQYILAQKLINDVLFEGEMETLNRKCRIVKGNDRQFTVASKTKKKLA